MTKLLAALLWLLAPELAVAQVPANQQVVAVGNATNSALTVTLSARVGATVWMCGFDLSGTDGTSATPVTISPVAVVGTLGGTMNFRGIYAGGTTTGSPPGSIRFNPCIPASGPNTQINVITTADINATAQINLQVYGFYSY